VRKIALATYDWRLARVARAQAVYPAGDEQVGHAAWPGGLAVMGNLDSFILAMVLLRNLTTE
jgi:hypothetical protein